VLATLTPTQPFSSSWLHQNKNPCKQCLSTSRNNNAQIGISPVQHSIKTHQSWPAGRGRNTLKKMMKTDQRNVSEQFCVNECQHDWDKMEVDGFVNESLKGQLAVKQISILRPKQLFSLLSQTCIAAIDIVCFALCFC
jgi:hypothetical protein